MGKIEKKLVGYLWKHCRGKEHAISKDDLAAELGISTRELRRIKRDIVIKEGKRIGSFEGGYFYAKTKREIEIFKNYYLSLIQEHLKTIKAYESMIEKVGQLKIDIGG